MLVALHFVRTDKRIYTPGEVLPDGTISQEKLNRLIKCGAVRIDEDTDAPSAKYIGEAETAYEPVETDYEDPGENEEIPVCMDAEEAVIAPKKGGKRKK